MSDSDSEIEEYTKQDFFLDKNFGPWLEEQMEFPKIPDTFRSLGSPWRVSDGVSQSVTINKVLERSFEVQASRIDASTELYRDVSPLFHEDYVCTMNRQCIEISGLLQYYFSWLDVDAKVFCGSMNRPGHFFKDLGKFHTFLEIEGEIIDNTYSFPYVSPLNQLILYLDMVYLERRITSRET